MASQNIGHGHIEYLKLTDFKKRAEAGRSFQSPLLFSLKQIIKLPRERYSPHTM